MDDILEKLEMVGNTGALHASNAISRLLSRPVEMTVADVRILPVKEVARLGGDGTMVVGLLSRIKGDIEGNIVFLVDHAGVARLLRILGSCRVIDSIERLDPIEKSMLEETANITISSFMNSMSSHLNRKCVPSAPIYLLDMADSILSVALMESAEVVDKVLVFSTRFLCQDEDIKSLLIFLPSPASVAALSEGLLGRA